MLDIVFPRVIDTIVRQQVALIRYLAELTEAEAAALLEHEMISLENDLAMDGLMAWENVGAVGDPPLLAEDEVIALSGQMINHICNAHM